MRERVTLDMKTWKGLCEQIRIFLSRYAYTRNSE